ncbi:Uncharacterised protein [Vibrio cholerae]|uniref:Uncharacterized protein n=1 Tax=Vibrio cholerae TaxID=666 RepID=A0A655XAQ4_VIBCL|nr:Uncharacterised protein [Vibrio cholerae]CSA05786.1 Uncharacterised protein [Vibrio cholerae]CSA08023.1 Uncharacterised protein [Vibrio cholerae]CSA28877.1 Uncharacterised protein [Vibrio cholerae]CSA36017.1 Uncharacterised protein [Vibrio cholerae]
MLQHSLADLGIVQSIRYIITFSRCTVVVRHFQIEHQFLLDLLFPVVDPNRRDHFQLFNKHFIHAQSLPVHRSDTQTDEKIVLSAQSRYDIPKPVQDAKS